MVRMLSHRDGTFRDAIRIGMPIEHMERPLAYQSFSIGDFDGNGGMDFLAMSSPLVEGASARNLYFFTRDRKEDEFRQRFVGITNEPIVGVVTDANNDFKYDIIRMVFERDGNVVGGRVITYLNNERPDANCVASANPADGCFFVRLPDVDISPTVNGQWIARSAFQAINLNPQVDQNVDLTLVTYPNGGNAVTTIYSLNGTGDGGFEQPIQRLVHNANRQQAPANTVLFSDFNNDGVGDVMLGFDDDGQAGGAWTYFGVGDGSFHPEPVLAVDINPNDMQEVGGGRENLGREGSGRTFDFDFDGNTDLLVGVHHVAYREPAQTRLYRGLGNGTFAPDFEVIGPDSPYATSFAIPQRICPAYNLVQDP